MASISWRMSRPGDTGDSDDGFPQLYRLRIGTGQLQQKYCREPAEDTGSRSPVTRNGEEQFSKLNMERGNDDGFLSEIRQ